MDLARFEPVSSGLKLERAIQSTNDTDYSKERRLDINKKAKQAQQALKIFRARGLQTISFGGVS